MRRRDGVYDGAMLDIGSGLVEGTGNHGFKKSFLVDWGAGNWQMRVPAFCFARQAFEKSLGWWQRFKV